MDATSLVSLFGQESGIPLTLGESGTVDLIFENDVTLTLEHDEPLDVMHCYVVLSQEPSDDAARLAVYRGLLTGNVFGHETEGATLAVDDLTGEILLTRRLELMDANVSQLRNVVQSMVSAAIVWREKLEALTRGVVASGLTGSAPAARPIEAANMRV